MTRPDSLRLVAIDFNGYAYISFFYTDDIEETDQRLDAAIKPLGFEFTGSGYGFGERDREYRAPDGWSKARAEACARKALGLT